MITTNDYKKQVINDVNQLKGFKISYIYWALPTLNTKSMEDWFTKITNKFSHSNGTIQIIKPTNDSKHTYFNTLDYWNLPTKYNNFQMIYNEKVDDYLKYFGGEFETHKNWYIKNKKYMKFIFAPIVELNEDNELTLFFINVNIYSNGVIGIELVEDLSALEFSDDLYSFKSKFLKDKLSPNLFTSQTRDYKLNMHSQKKQQKDLINNIKNQTKRLSQGVKVSDEHIFEVLYITNSEKINKKSKLYEDIKIENILINSPIIKWRDDTKEEDLRVPIYINEDIKCLNKAAKYIVIPTDDTEGRDIEIVSKLASYFFSIADYHFQNTFINELQLIGVESLNITDQKDILNFKNWLLKYKRVLMNIYRPKLLSSFQLYEHLEKNSHFKVPENLEEVTQDEMNIIQLEESYKKELKDKKMNIALFLLSTMAIFEILNIFTTNKLKILIVGILLAIHILYYTFSNKQELPILVKLLSSSFIIYCIYT